ncbi:hypothetical protein HanIR_Chr03g0141031 [Helianthus annuus]|nr:hypothetical protein HanIR_Chr03g0141031 [Helianthus annuus]
MNQTKKEHVEEMYPTFKYEHILNIVKKQAKMARTATHPTKEDQDIHFRRIYHGRF